MEERKSVWLCLPSASPESARVHLPRWKAMGYRIAMLQDRVRFDAPYVDLLIDGGSEYRGFYTSANLITDKLIGTAGLFVFAGDDMDPDPKVRAEEISRQFYERFPDGFGVMQPTGDRWGVDASGRCAAERICGSPFVGVGFAARSYGGLGPWPNHYRHFYGDEELKEVAERLEVLWQRPDLTHHHDHWSRNGGGRTEVHERLQSFWNEDQRTFVARKAAGFPGHEPISKRIMP